MADVKLEMYIRVGKSEFTQTVVYPGIPAVGHAVHFTSGWPEIDKADIRITEVSWVVGSKQLDVQLSDVAIEDDHRPDIMKRISKMLADIGWHPPA